MRELQITASFTNREGIAMEAYLNEIARISLLSPEEVITLARKIKQGDKAALDRLCMANLRFVVSIAKKYLHQAAGMTLTDLISEGNLGLIKAAQRFDDTRGFKFISFAVWWIRQSIMAAVLEHSRMIRIPVNKVEEIGLVNKASAELEQLQEYQPLPEQIADYLGISPERVCQVLSVAPRTSSYDTTGSPEEFSLLDSFADPGEAPDQALLAEEKCGELAVLLSMLPEKDRLVIEMSFGLGRQLEMNNKDIAGLIGLTPEAIRQIRLKALKKLRELAILIQE